MRIAILGMAKSGTTALFAKCRAAMPPRTVEVFEPARIEAPTDRHVLLKAILSHVRPIDPTHLPRFDRQVLITRDPRDRIVSGALYRIFDDAKVCTDDDRVRELLGLLRRKQRDPRSVPLREISDRLVAWRGSQPEWFVRTIGTAHAYAISVHDSLPGVHAFSYESLVAGDVGGLEAHLGLTLGGDAAVVPPGLERVVRARRSGDWRHWLCPSDVDWLRPAVLPFMRRYGYADDWTLAAEPEIAAEHSVDYVRRLVRERRGILEQAGTLPVGVAVEPPAGDDG